ncbi:Signal transduction histidine kinase CheA [Labilithrix luteola]|uniref:Signal transduction histidine kinase CheA n=1 Tax=Labilithrix luteola TaxID=1391654 RepID=A0A0K1PNC3_9BACT|nr:sigma 54-interacting transcriptional regulator [Labilithrix luteola]AKU95028.1 Signal transduction histidine kinase CheA [Labilithrix luteola]
MTGALLAAIDAVAAGGPGRLLLIAGYSGIGKSSVVNELRKTLVPPRALFAGGKLEAHRRDVPYAAVGDALRELARFVLEQPEDELAHWRRAIQDALGIHGRLLTALVPEIEAIAGAQPAVADLPSRDTRHLFRSVLRRLIEAFARPGQPLVLFLDDLQWVDAASLELVEDLIAFPGPHPLLLVGTYRDNEVGATHPLLRVRDALRAVSGGVEEVSLEPLLVTDVGQWLAAALHAEPDALLPLTRLVHEKTGGNPFFVIQFLSLLVDEGLIHFDGERAAWSWDLEAIRAQAHTDNVVEIMVGKLDRLAVDAQEALKYIAALGRCASAVELSTALGLPEDVVHDLLWEAVRGGLVLRLDNKAYDLVHDRVREAVYARIPEGERAPLHLRIGRRLLAGASIADARDEVIFEIVQQLGRGMALMTSPCEREELADLNRIAGLRARKAQAFAAALSYFTAGDALLPGDAWQRRPALAFELTFHRAECEFLTGDATTAEPRLAALASRSLGVRDLAAVTCLRMALYMTVCVERAIDVCLEYLASTGIVWTRQPAEEEIRAEYERLWRLLGRRPTEEAVGLPQIKNLSRKPQLTDEARAATMDVLAELLSPALVLDKDLLYLTIGRMVNLTVQHGNGESSAIGYAYLATILGPRFGDYSSSLRFGELSVDLIESQGPERFAPRVYLAFATLTIPWTRPLREARRLFVRASEAASRMGDPTFAAYGRHNFISHLLACGDPLTEIQREAEDGLAFARRARFGLCVDTISGQLQLIRRLRGLSPGFELLDGELFDESRFETHLASSPGMEHAASWYWIRKLEACFFTEDYDAAIHAKEHAERLVSTAPAFLELAEYHFYAALAEAARTTPDGAGASAGITAVIAHHSHLAAWAEVCPANFTDRAALVAAEIARLERRDVEAMRLYEDAIRLAREQGFTHHEALASELAGRFSERIGLETAAQAYFSAARSGYERWGAREKVRRLEQRHASLCPASMPVDGPTVIDATTDQLDLAAVVRLSQAVSGEIVLDKLVRALLGIALEYAGATRALLLVPAGAELRIEAEATSVPPGFDVRLLAKRAGPMDAPETLLTRVSSAKEGVIVDDAVLPNPFSADSYIAAGRVRSIFGLPLVKQGKLCGVLYLENNVASHVFTPARVKVLTLLAAQAAGAIENARLYANLQETEAYMAKAEELSRTGTFGWDLATGAVFWSKETYRIFELDPGTPITRDIMHARVHPDDRDRSDELVERHIRERKPWGVDYRIVMPDGSIKHLRAHGGPMDPGSTSTLTFVGAVTDVTTAKLAQQSLETALTEIRALKDRLQQENVALREEIDKTSMFEEIVGTSTALRAVLSSLSKVAPTDSTVLITGETGTGKELVARAIHRRSARSDRPFVSVNCAAIPQSLIGSELFGHEKGAFTGATERRLGRFEVAEGGTLFLDEVGDVPAETQMALLRVLQEHEFVRIGGSKAIRANVRVIAATNRDLQAAIADKTFRADLFYRLNVFPLEVPPLRERREDLPVLVEYFVERFAKRAGKQIRDIGGKALDLLAAYHWPGNIRELQNVIERAVIISDDGTLSIDARWVPLQPVRPAGGAPTIALATPSPPSPPSTLSDHERAVIEATLAEAKGRVSGPFGAAAKLGIPASTLESKIKALAIDKRRFKRADTPRQ